MISIIVIQWAK